MPADARPGFANGLTLALPSGEATIVYAPLSTVTLFHLRAEAVAAPNLSFCIAPVVSPVSRAISPG